MKKALITGISGFVGSHLAEHLLSKGFEVHGTIRPRSRRENIKHIESKLKLFDVDIKEEHSIMRVLKESKPDYIFHLAAQSFVPTSFSAPQETINTNVNGTISVLEAVRELNLDSVIQIAGSSEEYGIVFLNELPIEETNLFRPVNPYGVSKVGQDLVAAGYYNSYKIKSIVTRAFNHTGPRHGEQFVTSNFAKQIAEIESGKRKPIIKVGNLDAWRDFTDVRDIVRAYTLAVEMCDPGEAYNICSEKAHSIKELLNMLISLSKNEIIMEQDPARMRPSDNEVIQGDCSKFREKTGWRPEIPLKKTLEDLLNYWRELV